jgi:dihydroorotate dehydrogenase (fumarate)
VDLKTSYLGLNLPHPFMPGASPMVDDRDLVRRLEDAGAAAIVMHSLFEEQIRVEQVATHHYVEDPAESFAEAQTYMPSFQDFRLGPEDYLEQIRKLKEAVAVPVVASLNGTTPGGWLDYARLMEQAGADALELNVYNLATDPNVSGERLEEQILEIARTVASNVKIPVAIKLSFFYTSLLHFARRLDLAGVRGLVLFNRLYQPDIDIEELEVQPTLRLSDSRELLLRVRWLAILFGRMKASLAVTGGVHTAEDAVKAIMSGADAVQMVSALLRNGPQHLKTIREGVVHWMEEHEYESLAQMRGSMSLARCPDPHAFTRANYAHILQSWRGFVEAPTRAGEGDS